MTTTIGVFFPLLSIALAADVVLANSISFCKSVPRIPYENLFDFEDQFNIDQSGVVDSLSSNSTYTLSQCNHTGNEKGTKLQFGGTFGEEYTQDGTAVSVSSCSASFDGKPCSSCGMCPDASDADATVANRELYYDCSDIDDSYTCTITKEEACDGVNMKSQDHDSCFVEQTSAPTTRVPSFSPSMFPSSSPTSGTNNRMDRAAFGTVITVLLSGFMIRIA